MELEQFRFQVHGDNRGSLIALEQGKKEVPFPIKRVYYIFGNKDNVVRGCHAHKKLKQVLVCVSGSCKIKLDNGYESCIVKLSSPDKGLLIKSFIWREMYDFFSDAVLLVLASELYDESDYIRDYNEFLQFVKKGEQNI